LGKICEPQNEAVKEISKIFQSGFGKFKADKGVSRLFMSLAERYHLAGVLEGRAEGKAEGVEIGINRLAEFIKSGLSLDEAMEKVKEVLE